MSNVGYSPFTGQPCTNYKPYSKITVASIGVGGIAGLNHDLKLVWEVGPSVLIYPYYDATLSKKNNILWGGSINGNLVSDELGFEIEAGAAYNLKPHDSNNDLNHGMLLTNAEGIKFFGNIFGIGVGHKLELVYSSDKMGYSSKRILSNISAFLALKYKSFSFRAGPEIKRIKDIVSQNYQPSSSAEYLPIGWKINFIFIFEN